MKLSVSYTSGTSASATITVDGTSYSGTIAFTDGICVMGYPSHSHQYGASFYADDNEGTFTSMETFMQTGTIYFSYYEKPFWAAYALNVSN